MFKLGHNTVKRTKNICCAKGKNAADDSLVTRWLKKFCSGCENLNSLASLGRPKTVDSEAMLPVIEANPANSTLLWHLIVSYDSSPSQPWQKHLDLKHVCKILQNF